MSGSEALWQAMTRVADPLADRTVAAIAGPWDDQGGSVTRLVQATRLMAGWTTNASLADWAPDPGQADPGVAEAMQAYLAQARHLPAWARPDDIARAEAVFMDHGPLSCTLLFCASLPECYFLPHLAEVLHAAGQLEAHTEHRIRQTAAMVFPVMMKGGLTTPEGGGVAQILKVRLIHATIRHLILHGEPEAVRGAVAPGADAGTRAHLHQALAVLGWDVERQGLPCSQLELAYTLLTFSYVFLQGMRTLRLPLPAADEAAVLHAWNVAGHVLGIREELMVHSFSDAAAMFEGIRGTARVPPGSPDMRPGLGRALMDTMARSIRVPVIRGLPVPMTEWLVGPSTAQAIGASERVSLPTRLAFRAGVGFTLAVDGLVRLVWPQFSLARMVTRVVGYHMLTRFLLQQTRPLNLPTALLQPLETTVAGWHHDTRAPGWVNRLEDRLTAIGPWKRSA